MAGMGDGYVGTAADGARIRRLEKQREEEQAKMEELRKKSSQGLQGLLQFGTATSETLETAFKKQTVGLVTREQFVEKRATLRSKMEEEEREAKQRQAEDEEEKQMEKRRRRRAVAPTAKLSFLDELEEEEEGEGEDGEDGEKGREQEARENGSSKHGREAAGAARKKAKMSKFGKDPSVETSFLPDRDREAQETAERERLAKQWMAEQERIKNEPLEITYSYWDGAGHRRVIKVRKGDSIADFLRAVQQQLAPDFREVRSASVEGLVYVKEDLIIPHQYTFYELIINKARGKSGPLFHFDVHDDIRTTGDATIEKDESHAGKVVERHWYDKNKHIFPASRWEIYDPAKKWDRYTIHGN
ncbi:hypothetical protein CLOM_g16055 [Closterium sp. NIES-68]|nr:hypothetical protein CLOM_g16055 [Closterium sp. NIES-68]GJP72026.1 hypothetical protein CLOP_g2798 [Closterium sp. NIES-67]